MANYYDVLGVAPEAEDIVIEGAYRALLKRYHPDVHQGDTATATERTAKINQAYQTLRDPELRARYDRSLATKRPANHARSSEQTSPPPRDTKEDATASSVVEPAKPVLHSSGGGLSSLSFLCLAGVVLIGAVGSMVQGGGHPPVAPPEVVQNAAEPTVERPAEVREAPQPKTESLPGFNPSFDCAKADSDVLVTICESEELSQADVAMAQRYQTLLKDSETPDDLRAEQRAWLEKRDGSSADLETLRGLYQDRMAELGSQEAIAQRLY